MEDANTVMMPFDIKRIRENGLDAACATRTSLERCYVTAYPSDNSGPDSMFKAISDFASRNSAQIVREDIFGPCALYKDASSMLKNVEHPVTWLEGDGRMAETVSAVQAYIIKGSTLTPIKINDTVTGYFFEDDDASYCCLGALNPSNPEASHSEQAAEIFTMMENSLASVGMKFTDIIRTWLFNNNILEWYDDFNTVRTDFFRKHDVFNNLVPASTGVGMKNPFGTALTANMLAVSPKNDRVKVKLVPSPLQCPAPDYDSSFSRAVKVEYPDYSILYVSGTASIDPDGATAHVGDTAKQIELTMNVVEAILEAQGMDWSDLSRGTGYFRDFNEAYLFDEYCKKNDLPPLPIAIVNADICRDDLLFELEADAIKAR